MKNEHIIITESEIILLKNGITSAKFRIKDVEKINIRKGHYIKNWMLALIIGIVLILSSLWFLFYYLPVFNINTIDYKGDVGIYSVLVVYFASLFPFIFGIILIYQSIRNAIILELLTSDVSKKIPLTSIKNKNELQSLVLLLDFKLGDRFVKFYQ